MLLRPRFQSPAHPFADTRILNVHKLGADRISINPFQACDHLAQPHRLILEKEFRRNAKIEIGLAESELRQRERRILGASLGDRIDSRNGVPEQTVSVNESIDSRLQGRLPGRLLRLLRYRGRRAIPLRQISQLKSFKKRRPSRIDRLRIFLPAPVIFFDQLEIGPSVDGCAHFTLICASSGGPASYRGVPYSNPHATCVCLSAKGATSLQPGASPPGNRN